jgi:hypothetical protein
MSDGSAVVIALLTFLVLLTVLAYLVLRRR